MAQLEHDRGLGRTLRIAKKRVVRQHQVNPRRLNVRQCPDRVLQFAFQGSLVVDLFVELRSHPVGLVEDLKTQPPALQTLGGRHQSRLVQLRRRNQDAGAIRGRLKRNPRLG